jgi:hypothetical protein
MQRKQTAIGYFWIIVFVPQRKQRVYLYPRRGNSFGISQNNEILPDRNQTPVGLLPSDEFLLPSLPKNSEISRIVEKVLIYIFGSDFVCSISVSWTTHAEFSKLNILIIFPVFSLQEEYSTYLRILPRCAVLEERGGTDGQTQIRFVHLYKHRMYSVMFPQN